MAPPGLDALPFSMSGILIYIYIYGFSLSLPIFLSPLIASWEKICFALVLLKARSARVCLFWYVVSPPPQNFKEQIDLACCYCCEVLYWLYEYWPTSAWRRVILEFAVRADTEHTKVHWQKLRGVLCAKSFSIVECCTNALGRRKTPAAGCFQ